MADKFQKTKKKNYKNGKKAKKVKVKITKDDYYNKNTEFRVWLSKKYNMFLDEVKSEVLKKKFFKEFVKKWNKGKLPKVFYTGAVDSSGNVPATRFSWSFDTLDKHLNEHLSKKSTENDSHTDKNNNRLFEERYKLTRERKNWAKTNQDTLDEILPRPLKHTKDATIEKKKIQRENARHEKEVLPEISDDFLMGSGGGSDFQQTIARRNKFRDMKQAERHEKLKKYEETENKKVEYFKKMLQKTK